MEELNANLEDAAPVQPASPAPPPAPAPPAAPKRRTNARLLAVVVVLALLGGAIFYYLRYMAPYESTDDASIDGDVTMISSRVSGQVEQVRVHDNEPVQKGQVLLKLDPRDYAAKLAQAHADLAAARSRLDQAKAQTAVDQAKAEQAQAAVTAAQAEARRAAEDLKRYQNVESRAVSKSQLDLAEAQAQATTAQLSAARHQAKAAQSQVALGRTGVETAAAGVQQAQAKVRRAELNLSYTQIVAPRSGQVTARTVEQGEYVQPGQALLTLVPRNLWVVANFKETQLAQMRPGQPVEIHVDAYPQLDLKGTVNSLQKGTGARFSLLPPENAVGNFVKVVQRVPVKILFDEPLPTNLDLAPGMSVEPKVRVESDPGSNGKDAK